MNEWRPVILTAEEALEMALHKKRPEGVGEDATVMISDDMRLKDGQLADRDRAIFEEIRTGEGTEISDPGVTGPAEVDPDQEEPLDMVRKLAGLHGEKEAKIEQRALTERLDVRYQQLVGWIDDEAAAFIRYTRLKRRGTWRFVAGAVSEKYGTDWGEDQIFGMMLCQIAAERYGENYMEGAWN